MIGALASLGRYETISYNQFDQKKLPNVYKSYKREMIDFDTFTKIA